MAANIRPKNNQDAYNKVLKAIRKQNYVQSEDPVTKNCVYRGLNNVRCAAGHLIPNSLYRKSMEGMNIDSLLVNFPIISEYFENVHDDLLSELQSAHDNHLAFGKQQWEFAMKKIANTYGLSYMEPSKEI